MIKSLQQDLPRVLSKQSDKACVISDLSENLFDENMLFPQKKAAGPLITPPISDMN